MSLFSMLKRNAKLALKGKFGKAIGVTLLLFGATSLISVIRTVATEIFVPVSAVDPLLAMQYSADGFFLSKLRHVLPQSLIISASFMVITTLLLSPLTLGIAGWFRRLVHSENPVVSDVFHHYENSGLYLRSVWANVSISIRSFLWSLAFFAVPAALLNLCTAVLYNADDIPRSQASMATLGIVLSIVIFVLAMVFLLILLTKYALVLYLLSEDDNLSVGEAISLSVAYTKGYRFSLFRFDLSFIGWMLLCCLGFMLPALYVIPYMRTSFAMYYRYIVEKNRQIVQEETQEFAPSPDEFVSQMPPVEEPSPFVDTPAHPVDESPQPVQPLVDENDTPEPPEFKW